MGAVFVGCIILWYARDLIDALNNIADALRERDE